MSARMQESTPAAEQGLWQTAPIDALTGISTSPLCSIVRAQLILQLDGTRLYLARQYRQGLLCRRYHRPGSRSQSPEFEVSLKKTAENEQYMGWTITRNTLDAWGPRGAPKYPHSTTHCARVSYTRQSNVAADNLGPVLPEMSYTASPQATDCGFWSRVNSRKTQLMSRGRDVNRRNTIARRC